MYLHIDAKGIEEAEKALAGIPHGVETATVRALNRSMMTARTAGGKGVREKYTIKSSDVKAKTYIKKARYGKLTASLVANGSPIDLMKFKVRVKKKGIFAEVKKGSGGIMPHSFFITTGNMGIYHRTGTGRLPIQRDFGPSVPQMMGNADVTQIMEKESQNTLEERMVDEVQAILAGITSGRFKTNGE